MRKLATAAVLLLLLVLPAHSQSMRNADLDRVKDEIAKLRKRLDNVRQLAQTAESELEEVDLELGIRTRELELAVDQERRLASEQDAIRSQIDALTPRIAHQKADLRQRLVALYRLGRLSYLRVLLSLDGERNPIEAISMLSYLVSHDARSVSRFQQLQTQLASRQIALAERGRQLAATRAVVEERRRAVAASHEQKQKLLATLRSQEYGQAQQLATLEEKARRLQRLVGVLTQQNRGAIPPNTADIGSVKGALAWPVTGELVDRFGKQRNPKFSTVTTNNGVKIEAAPGTQVRAIFNGTVLYSQWFKGYGNLIILDHGNRVFSLYGNVKAPGIAVGDRVTTGQPIAGVGENEDAASGYLYFEIRQDNRPEDPQKWLR